MLSRIADSLYWLDRYMERTDAILLSLRTEYVLSLDAGPRNRHSWRPILEQFGSLEQKDADGIVFDGTATLRHIITDQGNVNSLRSLLGKARENARGAQDQITKEVWENVNHIYHAVNDPKVEKRLSGQHVLPLLDGMTEMVTLYKGVTAGTMPRGMGWSFMNIGMQTERCMNTLDIGNRYFKEVGYDMNDAKDILYWRQMLLSLSGYELHLKTYRDSNHTRNVADQVFFNRNFTRSIHYNLDKIGLYLTAVTESNDPPEKEQLLRCFGRLHSRVRYGDLAQVEQTGMDLFIRGIRQELTGFTQSLAHVFFSYA